MEQAPRRTVFRYGFVLLALAVAVVLRLAVRPELGTDLPFLFLWPVVMCCAWYGGLGPGLLATFLTALVGRFFLLVPRYSLAAGNADDSVGIILYLTLGVFLSLVTEGFHRARRQVEKVALDLYRQREWFRVTLASIGDAVIATDPQGRIVFMNEIAQKLTGWTEGQGREQPLRTVLDIVNEHTRAPVANPVERVLETGGIVGLANRTILRSRQGTELPIDDSAAPIRSEQGAMLGVVMVFRDVTERRRLENELQARAEDLVAADQRKNEFLAMLCHELRNPLTPIQNALELLKHSAGGEPRILQCAGLIERQAQQMRRLVEDLMDISRISRGKLSLSRQPLELADVIRQAVETSRPLIERQRHELSVSVPGEPIRLEGDFARLTQIVVNLLNNAAKYTDPDGRIELIVEHQAQHALLRVKDSGIGISAEMLTRVFDLYAQSERALPRSQGGLGIGLKLVRSLVEMHGGTIQATSDGPGKGSEFIVRLPLASVMHVKPLAQPRPRGDDALGDADSLERAHVSHSG